jgi:predicted signal transduction protein with EAL and GGDEF domain
VPAVFFIFVVSASVLFYLTFWESTLLLTLSYLAFFCLLPYYQSDSRHVVILRVNSFIIILIALLLSQMVNRMKLRSFLDQKTIESKNEALERLVMLDQMTQLLNHQTAFFKLQNEVNRATRIDYQLSLIIFDIDDFKHVNDQFGHPFGDTVIREVAVATALALRKTDLCGLYGGE